MDGISGHGRHGMTAKQEAESTSQPYAEETWEERIGHRMSWLVSVNLAQARVSKKRNLN